jgi:hypothetical protein
MLPGCQGRVRFSFANGEHSSRFSDDNAGLENFVNGPLVSFLDLIEQNFGPQPPHFVSGLSDGGQARSNIRSYGHVVETDDGKTFWQCHSDFPGPLHGPDGHEIIGAEHSRGRRVQCKEGFGSFPSVFKGVLGLQDQGRVVRDAVIPQALFIAMPPMQTLSEKENLPASMAIRRWPKWMRCSVAL